MAALLSISTVWCFIFILQKTYTPDLNQGSASKGDKAIISVFKGRPRADNCSFTYALLPLVKRSVYSKPRQRISCSNRKNVSGKGFFLWDHIEFAPSGRPYLYPPLFHALVAILGKVLGGSPWTFVFANDLVSVGIYSLGLYVSWYVGRKLYHEMGGFMVFTITSGLLMPALSMAIGLPSTLVFIFTPLTALWFLEGTLLSSFIACTASFYSHTSGVVITPITLMLAGVLTRKFRQALKVLVLSLLVYSPWLLRMLMFPEWFKLPEADIPTKIELALIVPAILGLVLVLRHPREHTLQLGYLASLVPVIISYPERASIQGCFALTLLATLFFKGSSKKCRRGT